MSQPNRNQSSPGALEVINAIAETMIALGKIAILLCVMGFGILLLWGMF